MIWLITISLVLIDQAIKLWATTALADNVVIEIIPGFFQLNYVENYGAAFGILQNQRLVFLVMTLAFLGVVIYAMRHYRFRKPFAVLIMVLTGGALGNLIDRMFRGYVVDYLDVIFGDFYNFPVFNFADICIVLSTILIALWVIFKESEIFNDEE